MDIHCVPAVQEDAEEAAALGALHALDAHFRPLLLPPGAPEAAALPPRPPRGAAMVPARGTSTDGCFDMVGYLSLGISNKPLRKPMNRT